MKLKTKTTEMVWSMDLDRFITEVYKRPYSCQQGANGDFWRQDTVHFFDVGTDQEVYEEEIQQFEEWLKRDPEEGDQITWAREYSPPLEPILNDLCNKGLVDSGDLAVHCWW